MSGLTEPSQAPDVLVIGGGTAALCAAISARRTGTSVVLLEQAPEGLRGGNTRHSRNLRFMHRGETPLASGPYPAQEMQADLLRVTGGLADQALTDLLIRGSEDITHWLADAGVRFQPTSGGRVPASRKTAFLLGGGKSMINALYATAERLGVAIHYEAEVTELQLCGRRLTDLVSRSPLGTTTWRPGAAIACCGGAQANRNWLRGQWGDAANGFLNRGTPFAQGEVLLSLLHQGAQAVGDAKAAYLVAVDARSPPDDGGIATRVRCMPAGIVVDRAGRRRHDEGGDRASTRYALWGQRLASYPEQLAYLVLDARGLRSAPPALYPPIQADSIEALAARLDLPATALRTTIGAYNAAVVAPIGSRSEGGDADTSAWRTRDLAPAKSSCALPIDQPPFSAYPMRPGLTFTYHGLKVDETTRIRRVDGDRMENLFAAGMIMAPNIIPRGYVSGLALTIGIVFGRIAGEEAARHARH